MISRVEILEKLESTTLSCEEVDKKVSSWELGAGSWELGATYMLDVLEVEEPDRSLGPQVE